MLGTAKIRKQPLTVAQVLSFGGQPVVRSTELGNVDKKTQVRKAIETSSSNG
jgi:hypothetical protein